MLGTRVPPIKQVETVTYRPGGFYPVHIGDQFKQNRYRIIHNLGHGDSQLFGLVEMSFAPIRSAEDPGSAGIA